MSRQEVRQIKEKLEHQSLYSNKDIAWSDLGFDDLSYQAQGELRKRLQQEGYCIGACISASDQGAISFDKGNSPVKQVKQDPKEAVRKNFINSKKEIEKYRLEVCKKNQRRADAARRAIENNFRTTFQRYDLSVQAQQLLRANNIELAQFKECVGNEMQQQIHQEFIDVLNDGAALYACQDITALTDRWYSVLSNASSVGCMVNNVGYYALAHNIADICEGLYFLQEGKAAFSCHDSSLEPASIEEHWKAAASYVLEAWQKGAGAVGDYGQEVVQKAARPIRWISEFSHAFQEDPRIIYEAGEKLILNTVECALDSIRAIEGISSDPFSKDTKEKVAALEQKWICPLRDNVLYAVDVFWQMPFKEKTQEILAAGLQIGAVVGAAKLAAALPAYAGAIKASALVSLNNLSQFSGSVFQTGVSSGGQAVIALEQAVSVSPSLVAEAEAAIPVVTAIANGLSCPATVDAICHFAAASKDGVSSALSGGGSSGKVTPKKVREIWNGEIETTPIGKQEPVVIKVKKGRFVRGHSLVCEERARDLAEKIRREMRVPQGLKKVGIQELKNTDNYVKHVLGMEHDYRLAHNGVRQIDKGLHHVYKGIAERNGLVLIRDQEVHPVSGIIRCKVWMNNRWTFKTLFPSEWSPEKVIEKIMETIQKVEEPPQFDKGAWLLDKCTDCGMRIFTVVRDGKLITSYPVWEK